MSLLEFAALIVIAGITGSIAQTIVGLSKSGCFISILVGFIGSFVVSWAARQAKLPEIFILEIGDIHFQAFWALLGAVLFTGFIAVVSPRRV